MDQILNNNDFNAFLPNESIKVMDKSNIVSNNKKYFTCLVTQMNTLPLALSKTDNKVVFVSFC